MAAAAAWGDVRGPSARQSAGPRRIAETQEVEWGITNELTQLPRLSLRQVSEEGRQAGAGGEAGGR